MGRIAVFSLIAYAALGQATVPFVGCKSDGQVGPIDAPKGKDVVLPIPAEAAARLAYYKADHFGVLGPRAWNCFRLYGSSGNVLFVSPGPINFAMTSSGNWKGFFWDRQSRLPSTAATVVGDLRPRKLLRVRSPPIGQ